MAAEGLKHPERASDAPSVPSTERVSVRPTLPAAWLDRLLAAQCSARPGAPLEEHAGAILSVVRDLLDDVAVGVSIPREADGEGAPLVIRRVPARPSRPVLPDPARLFPDAAAERAFVIRAADGSTLHLAAEDEARLADGTDAALLAERAVMMIAAAVEQSRAADRGLMELRAQVIQSEKLASLGQIAAGIVHELNNPLTTIVAYSDFLRKKAQRAGSDPADVERLGRINEAAERILRFSRDLTAYSRPSSESPAPVAIHDVIDRALGFCEHELDKTGVMVERNFAEVPAVRGVAGQLTQVFVNLFTNAAHAMREEGGLLTVSTTAREGEVEIVITDDGHGIDEVHRDRIFEPFFTTKTDGSGTGLGLSIVRSIVQNHGGRIRVDGNDPRGAAFHLELPAASDPEGGM